MEYGNQESPTIALIQREMGVLNQKVTKMNSINQYLMDYVKKSKIQKKERETMIQLSPNAMQTVLLVL